MVPDDCRCNSEPRLVGLTGPDVTKLSSNRTGKRTKFLPSVVLSYLKGEKAALYI